MGSGGGMQGAGIGKPNLYKHHRSLQGYRPSDGCSRDRTNFAGVSDNGRFLVL